jgi:hypothetical protein
MNAYQTVHADLPDNSRLTTLARASVRELEPMRAILWLDTEGYVCDCNSTAVKVLGCGSDRRMHVTALLPQLREMRLNEGCHLNSHLRYIAHLGHRFEAFSASGVRYEAELFLSEVEQPAPYAFRLIIGLYRPVQRIYSMKGFDTTFQQALKKERRQT